ncbi:thioesterase II family protein [Streptomyces sp. NPDC048603]|uniref:thioesterase II family protein n=1 Tax=Streptomyces sp. NPDC048603 TaxID=3365577 RepID=UPI00371A03D9
MHGTTPQGPAAWLKHWYAPRTTEATARRRLLCLPPAGGAAHLYRGWAASLPAGTEVLAVELPGHGSRLTEEPLTRMADVVDGVITALESLPDPSLPTVVLGHSMGAVIGWELCLALRHYSGRPVRGLVSVAAQAPTRPAPARWRAGAQSTEAELLDLLDNSRSLPPELRHNPEFLDFYLPVLRADLEILARHVPRREAPLPCELRVYTGESDPLVGEADAWPWDGAETEGRRAFAAFPGGHFFLHETPGPFLERLAADLEEMTALHHAWSVR